MLATDTRMQKKSSKFAYKIKINPHFCTYDMGKRVRLVMALVSHYKYAITIIIGILLVGFLDENSFLHRVQLEMQISDLTDEIDRYNRQNEADVKQLKAMRRNTHAFQKIARERYFMKADDEDIYVLSDDPKPQTADAE